ncbi:MAG: hypothetical protein J6W00_13500 [Lentisphaeria bacterium]|nr:hypothetical protein [Lentisphaeria bacterium]
MKQFFNFLLFCAALPLFADVMLAPGASVTDGIMKFRNDESFAQERNSAKFSVEKGITISAAVRLNKRPPITGSGFDEKGKIVFQHDFIAGKGKSFAFGRRSDSWVDQMYINFFNGEKWCVPLTKAATTPPYGQWAIWAVTLEPQFRREEGRKFTVVTLFINGEAQYRAEVDGLPAASDDPVRWAQGVGIDGKKWGLKGNLAEVQIFDRVLSDDEILILAQKSRFVKIDAQGFSPISPELKKLLAGYSKKEGLASWFCGRVEKAARNGFDQKALVNALKKLDSALKSEKREDFISRFNRAGTFLKLVETDELIVLVAVGKGEGAFPVMGALEKKLSPAAAGKMNIREIFGKQSVSWILTGTKNKDKWRMTSYAPWFCREVGKNSYEVTWLSDKLKVTSKFSINKGRITFDFAADNKDKSLRLEHLNFPVVRFSEKSVGKGKMVYPCQSGVIYENPVRGKLPSSCWYPSGRLNMQFGAYYDSLSGVYLSPEDPDAKIRQYFVRSSGGDLEMNWLNPVAFARDKSGGNSIAEMPASAVEVFTGNWFDAAMVYKKFVEKSARWSRPRFRPSPKWFEENLLWFCHWTFNDDDLKALPQIMKKMRDYFEVPFGIHWYRWYDPAKGALFPHAFAKDGIDKVNIELANIGVFTKAYIDNRLWAELDGPFRKSDFEFQKYGKNYAVLNADKTMNYERYSKACRDVVMCTAVPAWQEKMTSITDRVAGYGFKAVYHDQTSASRPFSCFNPEHGHELNDPAAWGDGYWKMFEKIALLQKKYPELAHDTEDASEAHMPFFDGFLTWRWTDQNQIPLFAAVYAGKTQFTGRHYENTSAGDEKSFMVKTALQLVQGEQIGWFTCGMMIKSPRRIVFAKQMVHLRKLLLNYFNGGTMLKPFDFDPASPMQTTSWGIAAPKPHPVTLPEIVHSRFKRAADGAEMAVFINTSDKPSSAGVVSKANWKICKMDASVSSLKSGEKRIIKLAPYEVEVWITSASDSEAANIAGALKKISGFKAGNLLSEFGSLTVHSGETAGLNFDRASGKGIKGNKEMLTITGNGKSTLQYKVKMILEKGRNYMLKAQIRKAPGAKGYIAIANYDVKKKLKIYGSNGAYIPDDGKWHEVKIKFKTDEDLYNCGMFFYNQKSEGDVSIDKISLKEL